MLKDDIKRKRAAWLRALDASATAVVVERPVHDRKRQPIERLYENHPDDLL